MGLLSALFGPPDPDRFARMMTKRLGSRLNSADIRYDAASFALRINQGDGADSEYFFLGNLYSNYCSAPRSGRKAVVHAYLQAMEERRRHEPIETMEAARDRLLPVIRTRTLFDFMDLQCRIDGNASLTRWSGQRIGTDIAVELVLDYPNTSRYVMASNLEAWGTSFEEALEIAKDNLRKMTRRKPGPIIPGVYVSDWADAYDASRLLIPEVFAHLEVTGEPVVLVPNRNVVIVTGSEDIEGLAAMASIAMEECEEPYPVSMIPLVLRRFEWSEFEIPPEHPCRAAFHRLKTQNRAVDYEQQKSLLERMHEKAGEDVFVASYLVFEKDAVIRSLCTWSDAGIQLLPETEFVVFMRLDGQGGAHRVGEAAWTNVREVLSAKMELSDLYPPRWKVDGVPDDPELALLDLR